MVMVFALFFFAVSGSFAGAVYDYDYWSAHINKTYGMQIEQNSPDEGARSCESFFQPYLKKGLLDIRYALGYFDVSTGVEIVDRWANRGLSPSLDIEVFKAFNAAWTAPCVGKQRLCGFTAIGTVESGKIFFQKPLVIHGEEILVRIVLTQASASDSFVLNKGAMSDRQKFLTEQSEDNYFEGLKTADIVFYNGHSRDGGGPDFTPPVLNSSNKTNYSGYYHVKKPGFRRMMTALKQGGNKDVTIGLFSCYSKSHFYRELSKLGPKQRLILSSDSVDYMDTLRGTIGYLEGFLRGACGAELAAMAKQTPETQAGFLDFNLE